MDIPRLTPHEIAEALARGERLAFVDARTANAFGGATEQIPGSTRVPPDDIDPHASKVPRSATAVTYCTSPSGASSARVALRLRQLGIPRIFALAGGFAAWKRAGLPVEPLRRPEAPRNASDHQVM